MVKQILAPLDGTMLAHMELPHAATLARATSSRQTLLHAMPPLLAGPLVWETSGAASVIIYRAETGRSVEPVVMATHRGSGIERWIAAHLEVPVDYSEKLKRGSPPSEHL